MNPDPRIEWCRKKIPGFAACNDQAMKAQRETEENRERMAAYMNPAKRVMEKQEALAS